METNKMREQFESKFQTPVGMAWCDVAKQYVKALGCICPATAIAAHNQLWKCWQMSREAVVVELPDRASDAYAEHFDDVEGGSFNEAAFIIDVKKAIEAQGLKVEVKP